jgi:dolichol-phosphate mannosyltransferase
MPIEVRSLAEWEAAGLPGVLSVVIPAHNEEGQIAETVQGLASALREAGIDYEVLVINDNSTDGTERILASLCRADSGVRYVNNLPPNGFGFAVRRGLAEFRGEAVAIVMADGSDDPADVVAFYQKLRTGYDCVFGSRFIRGGRVIDYPKPKLVLNRLANLMIRSLFLVRYNDVTNAFKLYRRSAIAGIQPLLSQHFNLTVELPLKCMIRGYRYAVLPNRGRTARKASPSCVSKKWVRATCSSSCIAGWSGCSAAAITEPSSPIERASCRSGRANRCSSFCI